MSRRRLYRKKVQFSLRTLFMAMATVAVLVFWGQWLATMPLAELGSFAIGLAVAVFTFRMLKPEEIRTLYLQLMMSAMVGVYALWIPAGLVFYMAGVGLGVLVTWQGPALLTVLCALYGIYEKKVYEKTRWQPSRRVPWPMGEYDSTVVGGEV